MHAQLIHGHVIDELIIFGSMIVMSAEPNPIFETTRLVQGKYSTVKGGSDTLGHQTNSSRLLLVLMLDKK